MLYRSLGVALRTCLSDQGDQTSRRCRICCTGGPAPGRSASSAPIYVDLLPPCNAGCPAGENIQSGQSRILRCVDPRHARSASQSARIFTTSTENRIVSGSFGLSALSGPGTQVQMTRTTAGRC